MFNDSNSVSPKIRSTDTFVKIVKKKIKTTTQNTFNTIPPIFSYSINNLYYSGIFYPALMAIYPEKEFYFAVF